MAKVISHQLSEQADLTGLCLGRPSTLALPSPASNTEYIKLLLEAFLAELDEIDTDTKVFTDMIEDTDQFISAHLDSVRNEIIKLSLFIEIGALVMSSGAVVSSIFGMNLAVESDFTKLEFLFPLGYAQISTTYSQIKFRPEISGPSP